MNKLKLVFLNASLFLTVLLPKEVFAGGGNAYIHTTETEDPHWNIVRAYVNPANVNCKGMVVTFNFVNPKDGDKISGSNGDNTSTTNDTYFETVNEKQYLRCSTYAKVYAENLEMNRLFRITFKGTNIDEYRDIAVSFYENYPSNDSALLPWENTPPYCPPTKPSITPYPTPSGDITVWMLNQQLISPDYRDVTIKWSAINDSNGVYYNVYGKQTNEKEWQKLLQYEGGPSATVKIRADSDYNIKVSGCLNKIGTCIDSQSLFVAKMPQSAIKAENQAPTITSTPNIDTDNNGLNQKIENLEKQLEESKKTQSILEKRINNLVNFIKNLFPFFK